MNNTDNNQQPDNYVDQRNDYIDPLEFSAAQPSIDNQQKESESRIKQPDTLYVDPLELTERDAVMDIEVNESLASQKQNLEQKTGGQPVIKELAGWLLVMTVIYFVAAVLCYVGFAAIVFHLVSSLISATSILSLQPMGILKIIIECIVLIIIGSVFVNATIGIGRRRMVFHDVATISTILVLIGLGSLFVTSFTPLNFKGLFNVALYFGLGIGNFAYFTSSKRVARTLINPAKPANDNILYKVVSFIRRHNIR